MKSSQMDLPEFISSLHALSRADKLRVIQHLIVDLAHEEGVPLLESEVSYPIWSPLEAYDAGEALLKMLEQQRGKP